MSSLNNVIFPLLFNEVTEKKKALAGCHSSGFCSGFIIYLIVAYIRKLESAQFKVIGPPQPVTAIVGDEILLPCHLSPRMNAENMEVTWYRSQLSPFFHLYSDGKDQHEKQMPEYRRRTELLKEGLTNGSVALRIFNVRPSDEGQFSCFVQDGTFYEEAFLELKVAASGSAPHISVEAYHDGGIQVVCRSVGWYPEPEVLWRDLKGEYLPSASQTNSQETSGLYKTQSSMVIRENTNHHLSCLVRNAYLSLKKESTSFYISDPFFPRANPWMVALNVILVILFGFAGLTVYLLKIKEKQAAELRWRRFAVPIEEVNVTLDPNTAHPDLLVSEDQKTLRWGDTPQDLPDNLERSDTRFCVLGCQGFTSGRHYWEVEVQGGKFWAVGVARESVRRKGWISRKIDEGIYAVERRGSHYEALTTPRTHLPLSLVSRKIRISLDYERGQVAFFNAVNDAAIYTFPPVSFAGERLRPWLWVWDRQTQLRLCP